MNRVVNLEVLKYLGELCAARKMEELDTSCDLDQEGVCPRHVGRWFWLALCYCMSKCHRRMNQVLFHILAFAPKIGSHIEPGFVAGMSSMYGAGDLNLELFSQRTTYRHPT